MTHLIESYHGIPTIEDIMNTNTTLQQKIKELEGQIVGLKEIKRNLTRQNKMLLMWKEFLFKNTLPNIGKDMRNKIIEMKRTLKIIQGCLNGNYLASKFMEYSLNGFEISSATLCKDNTVMINKDRLKHGLGQIFTLITKTKNNCHFDKVLDIEDSLYSKNGAIEIIYLTCLILSTLDFPLKNLRKSSIYIKKLPSSNKNEEIVEMKIEVPSINKKLKPTLDKLLNRLVRTPNTNSRYQRGVEEYNTHTGLGYHFIFINSIY